MNKPKANSRPWQVSKPGAPVKKMENRVRSRSEYHTYRWTKESKVFRESNPLCELCASRGIASPAEVVDHIIPIAVCNDFWDKSNWQSLCRKCNIEKGNRDKRLINEKAIKRIND